MADPRIFISGKVTDFDVRLTEVDELRRRRGFPLFLRLEPDSNEYKRVPQLFFVVPYQQLFMAVFRFCKEFEDRVELVVEEFSISGKPAGTVVGAAEHDYFKKKRR